MAERRRRGAGRWAKDGIALAAGSLNVVMIGAAFAFVGPHAPTAPATPAKPARPAPVRAAVPIPKPVAAPQPLAAATDVLTVKRILPIDGPIKYGDWHWDDSGVPAGTLVVTVDLDAETISVFRDGYEIGAAAVLYGADEAPTPLGVYPITQKDRDHKSTIYTGAPMPYMLRLTNDGVSIHGSKVEWGAATHGCIGVPIPFAAKLFAVAKLGDRVIITRGKRLGIGGEIAPAA